jgi:serine/threonine protein kinase
MSPATNVRYAAPELIEYNNFSIATTHSDTYSFALLILECITEVHPFSDIPRDATVIHSIISKKQSPNRPDGIPDDVWGLMNRCWVTEPELRPSMDQVHRFFLDLA